MNIGKDITTEMNLTLKDLSLSSEPSNIHSGQAIGMIWDILIGALNVFEIMGMAFNGFILLLYYYKPHIRSPSNTFVLSLATSHMLQCSKCCYLSYAVEEFAAKGGNCTFGNLLFNFAP